MNNRSNKQDRRPYILTSMKSGHTNTKSKRHLLFIQDFHGIVFFSCFVLYKHNTAKRASTKRLDSIEVVQSSRVLQDSADMHIQ